MPFYRKKPVVIEAEQYKEYGKLVKGMCNSMSCFTSGLNNTKPHVHTIHNGQMVLLEVGDYVIPEPDGIHYYPCKSDIFEKSYELIYTSPPDKKVEIKKYVDISPPSGECVPNPMHSAREYKPRSGVVDALMWHPTDSEIPGWVCCCEEDSPHHGHHVHLPEAIHISRGDYVVLDGDGRPCTVVSRRKFEEMYEEA